MRSKNHSPGRFEKNYWLRKTSFRERYLRAAFAHQLMISGVTFKEIAKILKVSAQRAAQIARTYPRLVTSVSPISNPYGEKDRFGDNTSYPYKVQRENSLQRQERNGWKKPVPWEPRDIPEVGDPVILYAGGGSFKGYGTIVDTEFGGYRVHTCWDTVDYYPGRQVAFDPCGRGWYTHEP